MEISSYCFLCKVLLPNTYSERFEQLRCFTCRQCSEFINKEKLSVHLPSSIKEVFYSEISKCPSHNKKLKLTCETCKILACSKCAILHSKHELNLLTDTLKSIYDHLLNLEYSITYTTLQAPSEPAHSLLNDFSAFYSGLQERPTRDLLSVFSEVSGFYSQLQKINNFFANIPILQVKNLLVFGRKNLQLLSYCPTFFHVEWGGWAYHKFDEKDYSESCYSLPDNLTNLLYCRLAWLPFDSVIVCGGRKSSADLSLPDSFIIYIKPYIKVRKIADMPGGRSNHLVVYCNDYLYVIGGLDSRNLFTSECFRFSLMTENWETISSLPVEKDTLGGCCDVFSDTIYVFGGKEKDVCLEINKYLTRENIWTTLSFVIGYESCLHGVFYFPFNQTALVFGGQSGKGEALNLTSVVNFKNETFEPKTSLPYKGGPVTEPAIWKDGKVFALFFEDFCRRKILAYDCSEDSWEVVSFQNQNRFQNVEENLNI